MSKNPAGWLAHMTKTGVKDLPSNAAWVVTKALGDPVSATVDGVEAVGGAAKERGKAAARATANAIPGVGQSGLDARLEEARAAVARAQEAEGHAVAKAQQARDLADRVRELETQHRQQREQAVRERDQAVSERVTEAKRRAEEMVEQERAAAEADEDRKLQALDDQLTAERDQAHSRAEAAQEEAREEIRAAEEQMSEARKAADEAADAAMEAAQEAHRSADELATRAAAQADELERRAASAKALGARTAKAASSLEKHHAVADVAGPLRDRTIAELLPVAAGLGIKGRTTMRHDELVAAITRARSRNGSPQRKTTGAKKKAGTQTRRPKQSARK